MKSTIIWNGEELEMKWFPTKDISKLDKELITQVYGILFDEENKICIVAPSEKRGWRLPGGKPEKEDNDDWKETLIREADEEADIDLDKDSLTLLGYIKVTPLSKSSQVKTHYLLRTTGKITKVKRQTIDPAEGLINERLFVSPRDFSKYCPWGEIGNEVVRKAMKEMKVKEKD
jgi:8-oxo-dGTP pyrophosphatase MutT (NUDIX family)